MLKRSNLRVIVAEHECMMFRSNGQEGRRWPEVSLFHCVYFYFFADESHYVLSSKPCPSA